MHEYLDLKSATILLKSLIPEAEWFLAQIESKQGNFRFPTYLSSVITNLKIEAYPLLYQNENAIGAMMFKGFMSRIIRDRPRFFVINRRKKSPLK